VLRRRQFCPGEKGGAAVGKTKRGKGTKWMVVVDGEGTPLGAHLDSASPAEVRLLEQTLDTIAIPRAHHPGRPRKHPDRLIGDRGYDSNALRAALVARGIEPIIPARSNNTKATHQDGRPLRRYRRRWIVERTFAWLGAFRRLVVRYEHLLVTYAGFFHLACAMLTLRRVMK
jgi:transposase